MAGQRNKKEYLLDARDIRPLIPTRMGCIATDRITVDGKRVGFCYREKTNGTQPDSGWRFFAGDETDEYLDDPDKSALFCLNTIANYDRSILSILDSPAGTAFFRDPETGEFVLDANWMEEQFDKA